MSLDIHDYFPPVGPLETPAVLHALVDARSHLAELKGIARTIPNERLLSTLSLLEAQSSSEIENIITTQDALHRSQIQPKSVDPASREVARHAQGLDVGFQEVRHSGLLTLNTIRKIQAVLEGNDAGFRATPGTVLQNQRTGVTVYEPPSPLGVPALMAKLEQYIHEESAEDPLVRMAVIHHHFETIHPF